MRKEYNISELYFKGNKLMNFPSKESKKRMVIEYISEHFVKDGRYTEKEINEILKDIFEDYALIRRYLVDYKFVNRTKDGSLYWK